MSDGPDGRKQAIAAAFERSAGTYGQVGADLFTPAGRDLVAQAGLRDEERVLDIGCGRGAVLFAAAEAVGARGRAVGIDLAPRMVELTAAEASARGLAQVSVTVGDAEHPDFAASSFDAVLAGFFVYFLPDPAAALTTYAGLLAAGGRVGFSVFAEQDPVLNAAMSKIGEFVPGGMPPRAERQGPFGSAAGIAELLGSCGFETPSVTETSYEGHFADPDHWLASMWSHGGRMTLERVPSDRLDAATEAGKAEFEAARTPAGDYVLTTRVRFAVASLHRHG